MVTMAPSSRKQLNVTGPAHHRGITAADFTFVSGSKEQITHIFTNSDLLLPIPSNPTPRNITNNLPQRGLQIRRLGRSQSYKPTPLNSFAELSEQEVLRRNVRPRDNQRGRDLVQWRFKGRITDECRNRIERGAVGVFENILWPYVRQSSQSMMDFVVLPRVRILREERGGGGSEDTPGCGRR